MPMRAMAYCGRDVYIPTRAMAYCGRDVYIPTRAMAYCGRDVLLRHSSRVMNTSNKSNTVYYICIYMYT